MITVKLIIRQKIDDSDDGESFHYEKRTKVKIFSSYSQLIEHCDRNYIVDFEIISNTIN